MAYKKERNFVCIIGKKMYEKPLQKTHGEKFNNQ